MESFMEDEIINVTEFLDRVQNDKELFFELLDIFMEDFAKKRQELEIAICKNDALSLEHVAHFLKGSCGNISAESLRQIFFQLERKGRDGNVQGAEGFLGQIDQEFEKLVKQIGKIRGKI